MKILIFTIMAMLIPLNSYSISSDERGVLIEGTKKFKELIVTYKGYVNKCGSDVDMHFSDMRGYCSKARKLEKEMGLIISKFDKIDNYSDKLNEISTDLSSDASNNLSSAMTLAKELQEHLTIIKGSTQVNAFKCVDAKGGISYQDSPCKGSKIEKMYGVNSSNIKSNEVKKDRSTEKYANIWYVQFLTMSNKEKNKNLSSILKASGTPCSATVNFLQGTDSENAVYYNVACSNGRAYVIHLADKLKAKAKIVDCDVMLAMGVPCFEKLK
ncbi:hypothetical protein [sulfur-oxidizing endosymbiont of Gigantopelta aegis]|uniref:hypothetical protein n=1 Tax=sulfur-oxidizing endosymbiont of Gigantopelta aegis TaxID=2794934 RepID=UPI0018DB649F|nr:hypothetical protein [sulfur-oxidizing endosymbiont of Gigantopelta aegis]